MNPGDQKQAPAGPLHDPSPAELVIFCYALWTVCCNVIAFSGGGLRRLVVLFSTSAFMLVAILLWRLRTRSATVCPTGQPRQRTTARERAAVGLLVLVAMMLTMVAHRPAYDDAHFINWAVAAIDDPGLPILRFDTTLSIPDAPLDLPVRRVQSFELLGAAMSWLLGVPAIWVFHVILPPLAAAVTVLAHGHLLRTVAPHRWLGALLGTLVFLVANGSSHYSHGNFSFVRLQHGKAVFLSVMLPVVVSLAIRWAGRPSRRLWWLLSAAQIGAIGLTSSALWAAPVAATLGLATGLPRIDSRAGLKRLASGMTSSWYVVGIGLWLRLGFEVPEYHLRIGSSAAHLFFSSARMFFGSPSAVVVSMVIILVAWMATGDRLERRLVVIYTAGVVVLLANPLVASAVAENLTSATTYWRVFWLLPLPTLAGLALSAPLGARRFPGAELGRRTTFTLLLIAMVALSGGHHILAADNRTRLGWPGLKVSQGYGVAECLGGAVPSKAHVIAPQEVSQWLTTLHHYPLPLLSRTSHAIIYGEEGSRRLEIKLYVSGKRRPPGAARALRDALDAYQITAVCLPTDNPWLDEIRSVLTDTGHVVARTCNGHEIWIREPSPALQERPGPAP